MAQGAVTVSGMFGEGKTYFANSPVMITVSGLYWGETVTSPFTIVRVEVVYNNTVVGDFRADTGGQTEISFDISSALRAIWSGYDFTKEVAAANSAKDPSSANDSFTAATDDVDFLDNPGVRKYREYFLRIYTEYLDSTDGQFTTTQCDKYKTKDMGENEPPIPVLATGIPGGRCIIGGMTEWERSLVTDDTRRDVSALEHSNSRNGDASTKPVNSPERVGRDSITSWVDVNTDGTQSVFFPSNATINTNAQNSYTAHAPLVLRDSIAYTDFLFVNRRGAVETCSGQMLEAMDIEVSTTQYSRVERPAFQPSRSMMAIATGGRRSWSMSSGYVDRAWAEWWTLEFLMARQWWMRYGGKFIHVTVAPAKKSVSIYDRTKQQMPHVDFTVTLALEG